MQPPSQDRPSPPRPWRLLLTLLAIIFASEAIVMILLHWVVPRHINYITEALVDAFLLTCVLAPLLWWIVIVPLRALVESRLRLLHRVFTVQEEERGRIARDLHDGLGQSMTSLLVRMRAIEESSKDPHILEQVREMRQLGGEAYDQVRNLARGLRPTSLDDFGLVVAIERYFDEARAAYSVQIESKINEIANTRLPEIVETNLYRVIQEATTNALKHGKPTKLKLSIQLASDGLQLEFIDNGRGFDVATREFKRGGDKRFGLWSMRERIAAIAGVMRIDSQPGAGTIIKIHIPRASLETPRAAHPSPHRG